MSYVQNEIIRALRERKAMPQKPLHGRNSRVCIDRAELVKLYP